MRLVIIIHKKFYVSILVGHPPRGSVRDKRTSLIRLEGESCDGDYREPEHHHFDHFDHFGQKGKRIRDLKILLRTKYW